MKKCKTSLIGMVAAGCLALPLSGWAQGDSSSPPEGCFKFEGETYCCGGVVVDDKTNLECFTSNGAVKFFTQELTFKSDGGIDAFMMRVYQKNCQEALKDTDTNTETNHDRCHRHFWINTNSTIDNRYNVSHYILFKAKGSKDDNYYFMNGQKYSLNQGNEITPASNDECKTWTVINNNTKTDITAEKAFGDNFELCGTMSKQKFDGLLDGPAWTPRKDNTYICPTMIAENGEIKLKYDPNERMDTKACKDALITLD